MKRFFKQVFITALGFLLSVVLLVGIILGIILFKTKPTTPKVHSNSILRIALHGTVAEHSPKSPLQAVLMGNKDLIDLVVLKKAIQAAQKDPHIQGIYLEVGNLVAGWASLEEIRTALQTFKETGKFIIAYGEHYNHKTYYLSSLADEIVLHPAGDFFFAGLNLTILFYKQLLDKLQINPEIFRVGGYKSAVEPFTSVSMSEASKQQSTILLHTIYDHMLHKIALARDLTVAGLKAIANDVSVLHPQGVYKTSLITQIGHLDDAEALINHKLGLEAGVSINYVNFDKYPAEERVAQSPKTQIAVVVASGLMIDGPEIANSINTKNFVENLRKLRKDPTVKAIVLRINSPGGSALASDTMWKELMLTKAVKPIVASMADVAASGGYYLATACHHIVAHPTTITGSIGVFSYYFNVDGFLKNKLGITRDGVKTGPSADLFSVPRALTAQEKTALQKYIEQSYDAFLEKVATGRQMDQAAVTRIAGGRVWPGALAKEHGLVDELGGLEEAIEKAAGLAGLKEDYSLSYWPKSKTWFEELLSEWKGTQNNKLVNLLEKLISSGSAANYFDLKNLQELGSLKGIQMRLPYRLEID
jgi:protease-4